MKASLRVSWGLVLGGAVVLRFGRAVSRWDEVAVAYAAYQFPVREALTDWTELPSAFVGLHPPLYGVLHGLVEWAWPAPAAFLGLSVLASVVAVLCVGKLGEAVGGPEVGLRAAALAATAPVSLHYAAEWNNYPLLLGLVAALYWAWWEADRNSARWWIVAVIGVLLGWTHLLGGVLAGGVLVALALRHRRVGLRAIAAVAIGTLPVLISAVRLAIDGSTFNQPEILVGASLVEFGARFGPWPWLVGALAIFGGIAHRQLAAQWAFGFLSICGMVVLSIAAPHQFPYWTVLMPLVAVLAALGGEMPRQEGRWRGALGYAVWALVAAQAFVALGAMGRDAARIDADLVFTRAIDVALSESAPGDAIWLVSPALEPDDDKRAISSVLWRVRPWQRFPAVRPFNFDYTDYQFGQPRAFNGRSVYTFTDFWADRMDRVLAHHIEAGQSVWVVLYDHGPAHRYPERLAHLLRPWMHSERTVGGDPWGLGVDRLVHVTARVDRGER